MIDERSGRGAGSEDDRPLAVFDLDGTLTRRDTFLPFLISYGRRYRRLFPLLTMPFPMGLYAARMIKDSTAKERLLVRFFGRQPMDRVEEHAKWFCRNWLPRRLNPAVVDRMKQHRDDGCRVLLVSASPSLYVPAVARFLGINEVICTNVGVTDRKCLGRLSGPNCKGATKLDRLRDYLSRADAPAGSFAYGDSRHDLPVLRWVTHGRLVRGRRIIPVHAADEQKEATEGRSTILISNPRT